LYATDNTGNRQCGEASDIAYSYDAYGNLTHDGVKTYTYDAENRLVSVTDGTSNTSYSYAGDGERVSQTVDGTSTTFVNDIAAPLTQILSETSGAETIYYLHGLDLVAQNKEASTEYFGYDGLGSVRQLWGSNASLIYTQVFDPYGNQYASSGTNTTNYGFTGEWQSSSTNLLYLRARYYSSYLNQDSHTPVR
jgi:YD repeat-containing protein